MERRELMERFRQLNAVDRNALAIYTDLLAQAQGTEWVDPLRQLVRDEARHVAIENEILALLEEKPQG